MRLVIEALEESGVDTLIGSAVAVWGCGEPRATQDLDMVVDIPVDAIDNLSQALEHRDMVVTPGIILDNIREDRVALPINANHLYSGYKAELFPLRIDDALGRSAMSRRQLVDLGPQLVYLHSPKDLILYKFWYYSLSRQTKHLRDIASIVVALGESLDTVYLEH